MPRKSPAVRPAPVPGNRHGTLPRDRTPAHRGYGRSRPRNSGTRHSRDGCFRCSLPSAPARFPVPCSPRPRPAGPYPPRRRRCRITHWQGRCQAWERWSLPPTQENRAATAGAGPAPPRDDGSQTAPPDGSQFPKRQRFSLRPLRPVLQPPLLLWNTGVSVSISAAHGKADCWQVPGARRPSFENPHWPGLLCPSVPTLPPSGPGVPASGVWHSGSVSGSRPLRPARIYGLLPHPHFHARPRVSCCGHRTMLLYGLPGLPFLQAPAASSLPVLPRSCPVSPGPFPAFPRRVPLLPVLSGTCPFCSRPSRRSPPAPVPCRYPAARPFHPPASCGQRDGFSGCPLETCRFWTSGHRGPKDCPARYPRPQTAGVGMVQGKALPVQPVRGDCPRYPPSAPAFENSVCPVSFR